MIKDTEEFCRKLRLREFFEDYEDDDPSLLKNKSGFKPQLNRFTVRNNFLLCSIYLRFVCIFKYCINMPMYPIK